MATAPISNSNNSDQFADRAHFCNEIVLDYFFLLRWQIHFILLFVNLRGLTSSRGNLHVLSECERDGELLHIKS